MKNYDVLNYLDKLTAQQKKELRDDLERELSFKVFYAAKYELLQNDPMLQSYKDDIRTFEAAIRKVQATIDRDHLECLTYEDPA